MNQGDLAGLLRAVTAFRDEVATLVLPLDLPSAPQARIERTELANQLDDYVLPRLTSMDAPLLAVVGGSTGAGKSTLVNSLVGTPVSRPGVLRPTTRSPVLVHNLDDEGWFTGDRVLPGLARTTGEDREDDPHAVRLVASQAVPSGLALLDAPDIDSVVASNRDLAAQLLGAADLWLFVTTAARYADAVPWGLLRQASQRGTSVGIILDRCPPEAVNEIRDHLSQMLREQGLATAPLFTIPETRLLPDGLLPDEAVEPLRSWLHALARDSRARALVVRQTLSGALDSLEARAEELIDATDEQLAAVNALATASDSAYTRAVEGVEHGMSDGTLLRGEVLSRWQEFVGTGEFFKQVESTVSKLRDRVVGFIAGTPSPTRDLGEALHTGVASLVTAEAESAARGTARSWRGLVGGERLLAEHPQLATSSPDLQRRVEELVRVWQDDVLDLVRSEGGDRRTRARVMAYGVNGVGVVLMLVAFVNTGGLTGAEAGIAGGTAVIGQKLLEAIFGDQAVRSLSTKARQALSARVDELFREEKARYADAIAQVGVPADQARRLSQAVQGVRAAR